MIEINLKFQFDDDDGIESGEDFLPILLDLIYSGNLDLIVNMQLEQQRATYH